MAINKFQQVVTYNKAGLARLQNSYAFVETANTKFKDFNTSVPKNLGDSVDIELPPRLTTSDGLQMTIQAAEQRVHRLTVDKARSSSIAFQDQEFIMNARQYMESWGNAAITELGNDVEEDVATLAETNTFRYYGDGVTPISTSFQLAEALARFRNFGSTKTDTKGYLDDMTYPSIINSNANQFTPERNNREVMSWELGSFSRCKWYESNLLKLHESGTEGKEGSVLTVVSVVKNADNAVTEITFSGTAGASDVDSIKAYDKFQFSDGVSGQNNIRFLTFSGYAPSQCPVQFRATADAQSTAGSQVTVSIYPPLQATAGKNQNISREIVAGMQVTVLPDHRCGLITGGNALFLAMPRLPDTDPYTSSSITDPNTGVSLRTFHGYVPEKAYIGINHGLIWGKTLVDEYAMMVAIPVK